MNNSASENQTSFPVVKCSEAGNYISIVVIVLDLVFNLPIQICVLWLGITNFRRRGHLETSEIFTMNITAIALIATLLSPIYVIADAFNSHSTILFVLFFSGSYMVGRPVMNSLICVERYIAVAYPVIYLNPAFVKHRYIGAGLVWILVLAYGGPTISIYPQKKPEFYIVSLLISILVITACSLGVLKILLRPSPGKAQKEGMHGQKKRAFIIITSILVCISVPYGIDLLIYSIHTNIPLEAVCVLLAINMWPLQECSVIHPVLYLSKHGKFSCISKLLNKTR